MKNKKVILPIVCALFIILLVAGTYSFWIWESSNQNTNISGSVIPSFSCTADGGGNITANDINLYPVSCTDTAHVIVRKIDTSITIGSGNYEQDLYLYINEIAPELSESNNLKWMVRTSGEGCKSGDLIRNGTFYQKYSDDRIHLAVKNYNATATDTYYLYIWLDEEETNANMASKSFDMSLTVSCTNLSPNKPYINNSGLIPIKFADKGLTAIAISEDDPSWYDYNKKEWANAVLVDSTNRSSYQNLSVGQEVTIPMDEILAYYVWIPRYSYQVWAYSASDPAGNPHDIPINFISTNTIQNATKNGDWYTHPAFWWDSDSDGIRETGEELSGIWVGKFEVSHATLSGGNTNNSMGTDSGTTICNSTACDNYTGLRVLPNKTPLYYNRIANFFNASRFMESDGNPFGLVAASIDSHMIKNREWGAVAYLSHSKYGIGKEIEAKGDTITGSGSVLYGLSSTIYPQSTTSNVTGVFDMSSGEEYVMGNSNACQESSGFSTMPAAKYYDNYPSPPFHGGSDTATNHTNCTLEYCGGHAINETYLWYNNGMEMPRFFTRSRCTSNPSDTSWFIRNLTPTHKAVGIFSAYARSGGSGSTTSSRLVLTEESTT